MFGFDLVGSSLENRQERRPGRHPGHAKVLISGCSIFAGEQSRRQLNPVGVNQTCGTDSFTDLVLPIDSIRLGAVVIVGILIATTAHL